MKADFKSKGPELLVDLAQHVSVALKELAAMKTDEADQLGREIADRMAAHWGGQNVYFPMGVSYKLSQRDRRIYDEFRGDNHGELARKYGVSIQWIYKIIKAVGREETAARQKRLFSDR
ncbi:MULTISPECIES: Mor transcription activator family protein [Burkholderia]|uniref:DNA-binding protein n=1 Tax=Burkholderia savannae TaxID=1637837 RepID=A0ABR5T6D1_9BURK|nr:MULTISPECIES: Mor transcription activator family protein [Burkholderia]AOJ71022.1 DNA-binding protein [Burkholderia savannae]AOK49414.1 DNA-binding protein [Burkholderia sp. MSMB617WGS]KGS08279.1 mor transcription activator family protein [Burkholderia sp. ABCPW 111]KVG48914.1 DNA-binding protein [Burkholderia sp. MSMB0265]KVG86375.1 DNA-binding protein [Burkholderia sp. MSMB2040]